MIGNWLGRSIGHWLGHTETATEVEQPAVGGRVRKDKIRLVTKWLASDYQPPPWKPARDPVNENAYLILAGKA